MGFIAGLARKFGNNDAAGPFSRQRGKSEQGQRRYTHVAEVVAPSVKSGRRELPPGPMVASFSEADAQPLLHLPNTSDVEARRRRFGVTE